MDIDMSVYHGELRARLRRAEAERAARVAAGVFDAVPRVSRALAAKDVLVTGGSGFMGRVLLEKLLRSCPDIGTVYLLLRAKKGVAPADRVADIVNVPLFDQVRREQPECLSKLVAVSGDCAELGLGLAAEDRAMLRDRVSVVFHGAASVRFDDPVQKAVLLNTRGAREVAELCAGMRQLQASALVYTSTAYTNMNQDMVEERLYPAQLDWRRVIRAAEDADTAAAMDNLGPKLLRYHPNTYTFSKALAEHIMAEAAASLNLPVVIVRPTVVIGAAKEPLVGWLDNLNSPATLWAAVAMGVIRVSRLFSTDAVTDYLPVDIVTKATIMAAWSTATDQWRSKGEDAEKGLNLPVVNVAISDVHAVPGWVCYEIYHKSVRLRAPAPRAIRYPVFLDVADNWLLYTAMHLVYHVMFGAVMDGLLRLTKQKPRLMKVYRKLELVNVALKPLVGRKTYAFDTSRFWKLQGLMHPDDIQDFDLDLDSLDPRIDGSNQLEGIYKYALKENFDRQKALQHNNRLFWIEIGFYMFVIALFIFWYAF
ncbi:Fatty acyl-CoA reductase 1 [Frankliniella fusca]|uniref:Fatty acyl-CoA reductase n=1 Tax=Frankliniella fusca TaxID=407009 RepID=A0AAE1LJV5_9NEOP|nr:Fatty acyl-CoA reductase 1 [Frankliniella fusca]